MIIRREYFDTDLSGEPVHVLEADFSNQAEQVAFLRQMVHQYRGSQYIRDFVVRLLFDELGLPEKAKAAHAVAIGQWVQRNITYVNEGPETFATPLRTLRTRYGDCDDFASLTCTMLEAVGIPSELVAIWTPRPAGPVVKTLEAIGVPWQLLRDGSLTHIFARAVVMAGGRVRRLPLDGTLSLPIGRTNPLTIAAQRAGGILRTVIA